MLCDPVLLLLVLPLKQLAVEFRDLFGGQPLQNPGPGLDTVVAIVLLVNDSAPKNICVLRLPKFRFTQPGNGCHKVGITSRSLDLDPGVTVWVETAESWMRTTCL